jgi:hypothetical protein
MLSNFSFSAFQRFSFCLCKPTVVVRFDGQGVLQAEFWPDRLPKLIGLSESTAIVIQNSGLDPFLS